MSIKVGDIFYTSWGYDQTQNDFLIVEEVSPSGKTVKCRMIKKALTTKGNQVYPAMNAYGVQFRMKVSQYRSTVGLRGSYPFVQTNFRVCKLFRENGNKCDFKCTEGLPEEDTRTYYMWSISQREAWCHDCPNMITEEDVSKRFDSFSRWEGEPTYETPFGMEH